MAPRGHLAHARRRHRLHHRRAARATSGRSPARAPRASGMVRLALAPLIHGAAHGGHAGVRCSPGTPSCCCRSSTRTRSGARSSGTRSTCSSIIGDAMARPLIEALRAPAATTRPRWSPCRLQRRAVLARGQGRVPASAAERGHHRRDRLLRDRLHRHRLRQRGRRARAAARRSPRAPTSSCSTTTGGAVRPRADRPAGPRRAHPARLLQGPGEDRGDVRRGRRQALRGARRLRPGRGRRHDHAARPRATRASTPAARRSSPRRSRAR